MITYELATVKFNNGEGALLCNRCRTVITTGLNHEDKLHFCQRCSKSDVIDYLIEYDADADTHKLYSVVATNFGGPAKNYVASGPLDSMQGLRSWLSLDELARLSQELGLE